MKDIIKIENALPPTLNRLFKENLRNAGWFVTQDVTIDAEWPFKGRKEVFTTIQLFHMIHDIKDKTKPVSPAYKSVYDALKIMVEKCGFKLDKVFRMKFNMLLPHPEFKEGMYNTPHIDHLLQCTNKKQYNLIYYPLDSDGDTILFNQKVGNTTDPSKIPKLTIRERVTPTDNSAVVFRGNILHTSSNPTSSDTRIVLNCGFTVR